jgi:hypothetical protein
MFLGLIGLAIAFDNLWLLILLVPFALVIRYGVVNEGIVCAFVGAGRFCWRRQDLHFRPLAAPPALYALRVEANISSDYWRAIHDRPFNLRANPIPFLAIERQSGFDSDDLRAFISERNPALLTGKRQVDYVLVTVVLTVGPIRS